MTSKQLTSFGINQSTSTEGYTPIKTVDGKTMRSRPESSFYRYNSKSSYEPSKFTLKVTVKYVPDFLLPDGTWVEIKGLLDAEGLRKITAFAALGNKIIVGLQKPFVLFGRSKVKTIEQVLDEKGIPYFYVYAYY